MHAQLPPEMWDIVIDYLWEERSALAVCSLTCRGWLQTAQFHLFSYICLDARNLTDFQRLIAQSNHIAEYVTTLTLLACTPLLGETVYTLLGFTTSLPRTTLTLLGRERGVLVWASERLPRIKHLSFRCWDQTSSPYLDTQRSEGMGIHPETLEFPFLQSIQFMSGTLDPIILKRLLRASPKLSSISISYAKTAPPVIPRAPSQRTDTSILQKVTSLHISSFSIWHFLTSNRVFNLQIRTLRIACGESFPASELRQVLANVGPTLENLTVAVDDSGFAWPGSIPEDVLGLAHTPCLVSLHLKYSFTVGAKEQTLRVAAAALASIQSDHNNLRSIIFSFWPEHTGTNYLWLDYSMLDSDLARIARFGQDDAPLVVTFAVVSAPNANTASAWSDHICSGLPELQAAKACLRILALDTEAPGRVYRQRILFDSDPYGPAVLDLRRFGRLS